MKVVILAGGLGTRLAEETVVRPKPMVEIGGRPILWHILKHYASYGHNDFFIALGYKGEMIKKYMLDYYNLSGNITIDMNNGKITTDSNDAENWIVNLIDTKPNTFTGGRVKRLEPWLKDGTFMVTYGDGVSNIDILALLDFHRAQGKMATISAVHPPARFGTLTFDGELVAEFSEKPQTGEGWINGGFMVFEPEIFEHLEGDESSLESALLEHLAGMGQLAAYRHFGFWQCMDTMRDVELLRSLWESGDPPWKVWDKS